jgi:hypothetical protein
MRRSWVRFPLWAPRNTWSEHIYARSASGRSGAGRSRRRPGRGAATMGSWAVAALTGATVVPATTRRDVRPGSAPEGARRAIRPSASRLYLPILTAARSRSETSGSWRPIRTGSTRTTPTGSAARRSDGAAHRSSRPHARMPARSGVATGTERPHRTLGGRLSGIRREEVGPALSGNAGYTSRREVLDRSQVDHRGSRARAAAGVVRVPTAC